MKHILTTWLVVVLHVFLLQAAVPKAPGWWSAQYVTGNVDYALSSRVALSLKSREELAHDIIGLRLCDADNGEACLAGAALFSVIVYAYPYIW